MGVELRWDGALANQRRPLHESLQPGKLPIWSDMHLEILHELHLPDPVHFPAPFTSFCVCLSGRLKPFPYCLAVLATCSCSRSVTSGEESNYNPVAHRSRGP